VCSDAINYRFQSGSLDDVRITPAVLYDRDYTPQHPLQPAPTPALAWYDFDTTDAGASTFQSVQGAGATAVSISGPGGASLSACAP
jgi:hypothetical protein